MTEEEAQRFDRIASSIDRNDDCVHFLTQCVEKLIEIHRPKYTDGDIIEMHKHLG